MSSTCDILVVGGGPAGAACAGLLAAMGRRVIVCEQKEFPRDKVCGEFLSAQSRPVLARLGVLEAFDALSHGPIRRVLAVSSEGIVLTGDMPSTALPRTLGRDVLDDLLLHRATELGAQVRQPCHVRTVERRREGFVADTSEGQIAARRVVLALGLAQRGDMSSTAPKPLPGGYLCFKTHLDGCTLPGDTIAITGAQGVYAGLVRTDGAQGAFALAFVVDRERLARHGSSAAAQFAALRHDIPRFDKLLGGAAPGEWLSSGPLRPGIRTVYHDGRFFVGNAAGEVHALVGEGITLALRGAMILADTLQAHAGDASPEACGRAYERRWRAEFTWRYVAANIFARIAMRPALASLAASLLERQPELFRACIQTSGKW